MKSSSARRRGRRTSAPGGGDPIAIFGGRGVQTTVTAIRTPLSRHGITTTTTRIGGG